MTVNKLFLWIIRLVILCTSPYWLIRLFYMNKGLNTFEVSFRDDGWFVLSFLMCLGICGFMFVTFIFYLFQNNQKSVAIVFSYNYLKENYWKDVNKAFL